MAKTDKPADAVEEQQIENMSNGADEAAAALDTAGEMTEETSAETIETPTLSAKEMETIRKQAREAVDREFRSKLKDKVLAAEKKKLRDQLSMTENEHLNGRLSDLVRITIDIPEFSNVPWIQLNQPTGACYFHGQTYTVKRHVGNTLREAMQNMRRHQNEIDGKKKNRQLPDGRFVDVVSGFVSQGRTVSAAEAA